MALYVIGDLHLSQSTNKSMEVFGKAWDRYTERLAESFLQLNNDDVIVICGDISWGMDLDSALEDLKLLNSWPGKKILSKGNHDYWWNTKAKMERYFREHNLDTLSILHNNSYLYQDYAICGTRGWFYELDMQGTHDEKILNRELGRLEASLISAGDKEKLCFLHYPPLYLGYKCPEILALLQKYEVKECYYGHLHGASHKRAMEGTWNGTKFALTSADYLGFIPKKISE